MSSIHDFKFLLSISFIATICIIIYQWRRSKNRVGITATYLVLLFQHYWLSAALYILPWYRPMFPAQFAKIGLEQFVYGLGGFALGTMVLGTMIRQQKTEKSLEILTESELEAYLPILYCVIGIVFYLGLGTYLNFIPSMGSIGSNMVRLIPVGIILGMRRALNLDNRSIFTRWLLLAIAWPLVSIVSQGFLRFALLDLTAILLYLSLRNRINIRTIALVTITGYLLLSVFVTYAHGRDNIRTAVWYTQSSLSNRISTVFSNFAHFEWFSLHNPLHLSYIDQRSGQIQFTGIVAERLSNGVATYAGGKLVGEAILMMVPRIIWPAKPISLGGNSLVTYYTGIPFARNTSVAMGPLMEFYISFGTAGVFIGFMLLGMLLELIDRSATLALQHNNEKVFALWYVIGLGMLQPEDRLIAVTGSAISGLVTMILVNRYVIPSLHAFLKARNSEDLHWQKASATIQRI